MLMFSFSSQRSAWWREPWWNSLQEDRMNVQQELAGQLEGPKCVNNVMASPVGASRSKMKHGIRTEPLMIIDMDFFNQ